jgi:hypothetical protein
MSEIMSTLRCMLSLQPKPASTTDLLLAAYEAHSLVTGQLEIVDQV